MRLSVLSVAVILLGTVTFSEAWWNTRSAPKKTSCRLCKNQASNDLCNQETAVECDSNQGSCQTVIRKTNQGVSITKHCKQTTACESDQRGNARNCNARTGVCHFCCQGDECNDKLPDNPMVDAKTCTTGECVSDCNGKPDGDYQHCGKCSSFIKCSNNNLIEAACGATILQWDDKKKLCDWSSDTCTPCNGVAKVVDHVKTHVDKTVQHVKDWWDALFQGANVKPRETAAAVCEGDDWTSHNGNCYFVSDRTANWRDAEALCERQESHLVNIKDQQQQNFLQTIIVPRTEYWTGLKQVSRNKYEWDSDDTSLDYNNWHPSEPDHSGDCVRISTDNYLWRDMQCTRSFRYVCQKDGNRAIAIAAVAPILLQDSDGELEEVARLGNSKCNDQDKSCATNLEGNPSYCDDISNPEQQCRLTCGYCKPTTPCGKFYKEVDGACIDRDECAEMATDDSIMTCPRSSTCVNMPNGYECQCHDFNSHRAFRRGDQLVCDRLPTGWLSSKVCASRGDPHFRTLDDVTYDFQGQCSYRMIQPLSGNCDDGLCVSVKLDDRGRFGSVTWTDAVHVLSKGVEIILGKQNLIKTTPTAQWREIEIPETVNNLYSLTSEQRGDVVRLRVQDLTLLYHKKTNLNMYVSATLKNQIDGLCGNYDDDGAVEAARKTGRYLKTSVAESFLTAIPGVSPPSGGECVPPQAEVVVIDPEKLAQCEQMIKSTPIEVGYYDMENGKELLRDIFHNCAIDMDNDFDRCAFLKDTADGLQRAVEWRAAANCLMDVPEDSTYHAYRNDWVNTCKNPDPAHPVLRTGEGYLCDDGYYESGEKCVKPEACGCSAFSYYRQSGEVWYRGSKKGRSKVFYRYECKGVAGIDSSEATCPKPCKWHSKGKGRVQCKDKKSKRVCEPVVAVQKIDVKPDHVRKTPSGKPTKRSNKSKNSHKSKDSQKTSDQQIAVGEPSVCRDTYKRCKLSRCGRDYRNMADSRCKKLCRFCTDQPCRDGYMPRDGMCFDIDECSEGLHNCGASSTCRNEPGTFKCICPRYQVTEKIDRKMECYVPATCVAKGDPHYTTFDGNRYDFQGTCKYILMKTTDHPLYQSFQITAKNVKKSATSLVSIAESFDIDFVTTDGQEYSFHILNSKITQIKPERQVIQVGQKFGPDHSFILEGDSRAVTIITPDLTVHLRGDRDIRINVPRPIFAGKVHGLCGNCDGKTDRGSDEFLLKDKINWNAYGNKFAADPDTCGDAPDPPTVDQKYIDTCLSFVGASTPFKSLDRNLQESFGQTCGLDMSQTSIGKCDLLQAFANSLYIENNIIVDWRKDSGCPLDCRAEGKVYLRLKPDREATCSDQTPWREEDEGLEEDDGCVCRDDHVLSGTECIPPALCGCEVNDVYYPADTKYIAEEADVNGDHHFYEVNIKYDIMEATEVSCIDADCEPRIDGCKRIDPTNRASCPGGKRLGDTKEKACDDGYDPISRDIWGPGPGSEDDEDDEKTPPKDDGKKSDTETGGRLPKVDEPLVKRGNSGSVDEDDKDISVQDSPLDNRGRDSVRDDEDDVELQQNKPDEGGRGTNRGDNDNDVELQQNKPDEGGRDTNRDVLDSDEMRALANAKRREDRNKGKPSGADQTDDEKTPPKDDGKKSDRETGGRLPKVDEPLVKRGKPGSVDEDDKDISVQDSLTDNRRRDSVRDDEDDVELQQNKPDEGGRGTNRDNEKTPPKDDWKKSDRETGGRLPKVDEPLVKRGKPGSVDEDDKDISVQDSLPDDRRRDSVRDDDDVELKQNTPDEDRRDTNRGDDADLQQNIPDEGERDTERDDNDAELQQDQPRRDFDTDRDIQDSGFMRPPNVMDEAPAGDDGTDETPDGEDGTDETPDGEDGTDESPAGEDGTDESPAGEDGTDESPAGEDGTDESPAGEDGTDELPAGEDGTDETPAGEDDGTDETPAGEDDGTDESPAGEDDGTDETPDGEDGTDESPAGEDDGTDETPAGEDGTDETPAGEDGTDETPADGILKVDEPGEETDLQYALELATPFVYPVFPVDVGIGITTATATSHTILGNPTYALRMSNPTGWVPFEPEGENTQECLVYDMKTPVSVHGFVSTGGIKDGKCAYVTRYTVEFSVDSEHWEKLYVKGTKNIRLFKNSGCSEETTHCTHAHYDKVYSAQFVRVCIPASDMTNNIKYYVEAPVLKFQVKGFRAKDDPALIRALATVDINTKALIGAHCYWNVDGNLDCAICEIYARQCGPEWKFQCVKSAHAEDCGSVTPGLEWGREPDSPITCNRAEYLDENTQQCILAGLDKPDVFDSPTMEQLEIEVTYLEVALSNLDPIIIDLVSALDELLEEPEVYDSPPVVIIPTENNATEDDPGTTGTTGTTAELTPETTTSCICPN